MMFNRHRAKVWERAGRRVFDYDRELFGGKGPPIVWLLASKYFPTWSMDTGTPLMAGTMPGTYYLRDAAQ
jgi:hypothetical protein